MDKNLSPSTCRPAHRSFGSVSVIAVAVATTALLAGSCGNSDGPITGGVVTGGATAGTAGPGGATTPGVAGPSGTGASGGSSAVAPGTTAGGVSPVNGAGMPVAAGSPTMPGASPVGAGAGSAAPLTPGVDPVSSVPAAEPCVDVEPPPDPEWPDATCATWATETEECSATWFSSYCDLSCGRCVPEGGAMSAEPEPEPCEDVLPPPDPEWPDATCEGWATETEECAADWFANYCDISCGRCIPEGGLPEPEPEVCEDVEPPPSDEWPGATCFDWAVEAGECDAEWFANYCDVSCGRCVPDDGSALPGPPDCSAEGLPQVSGGEGFATRYWDCCQPHCAQQDGHKCSQDGTTRTGDGTSACNGGGAYACYDEAPRAVSECLSYGYIAKANPNCGGCYRIQFTGQGEHLASDPGSQLIRGKQMIVKVSNTGSDVAGNQFDLMIPGGGVGMFNACSNQWGTNDLGAQFGGFLAECSSNSFEERKACVRQGCMKIPAGGARDGCLWFVDWLQIADNPKFTSQPTDCPF